MEDVKELSDITLNICKRLEEYKENIRKDMVVGDLKIILGIELVEKMIKEINPLEISTLITDYLNELINNYLRLMDKEERIINNYMMFGIERAYFIVNSFVRVNLKSRKREKLDYIS